MTTEGKSKAPLIIAALLGAGALGVGGYYFNERQQCQGLEEDYLNTVSAIRSNVLTKSVLPGNAELRRSFDRMNEREMKSAERHMNAIYDRCGERAGQTAFRKGSAIMLGGA